MTLHPVFDHTSSVPTAAGQRRTRRDSMDEPPVGFGLTGSSSAVDEEVFDSDGECSRSSGRMNRMMSTVKVHTVTTGETFGVGEALKKQLETCVLVQVKKTNLQEAAVVVLFCPISSRVGSDVEAAMTQVAGDKEVVLVMMHYTTDVDYSTSGRNWSEPYPQVVMDVDVFFHQTTAGLLRCQRNEEAVCKIEDWLLKHSTIHPCCIL